MENRILPNLYCAPNRHDPQPAEPMPDVLRPEEFSSVANRSARRAPSAMRTVVVQRLRTFDSHSLIAYTECPQQKPGFEKGALSTSSRRAGHWDSGSSPNGRSCVSWGWLLHSPTPCEYGISANFAHSVGVIADLSAQEGHVAAY